MGGGLGWPSGDQGGATPRPLPHSASAAELSGLLVVLPLRFEELHRQMKEAAERRLREQELESQQHRQAQQQRDSKANERPKLSFSFKL